MGSTRIAGLSMKGGRRDNFFFCLLDHYEDGDRWFLKSVLQVDDDHDDGDDAIRSWIDTYQIENIVVDFPLSNAACKDCEIECPGISRCPVPEVKHVQEETIRILKNDKGLSESRPKDYERLRNEANLFDHSRDLFEKWPVENVLSKSFKRRLKKGFIPYWNRSLDFWVWCFFHDQLLSLFKSTFDSFGNTSLMMLSRFSFLKRHFPENLSLYEANANITLLELIRAKILLTKNIQKMSDFDLCVEARLDIIKKIESKLNIFIYEHDLEILVKDPRAFDSFILAIAGQRKLLGKFVELPEWTLPKKTNFILPAF